mmetsp:Transcript_101377/g.175962  ORF Transcript_101377/g.175962 Transcript_101377/m.175962 type:complete len:228 (+) Transcript_101377:1389-2072(+)
MSPSTEMIWTMSVRTAFMSPAAARIPPPPSTAAAVIAAGVPRRVVKRAKASRTVFRIRALNCTVAICRRTSVSEAKESVPVTTGLGSFGVQSSITANGRLARPKVYAAVAPTAKACNSNRTAPLAKCSTTSSFTSKGPKEIKDSKCGRRPEASSEQTTSKFMNSTRTIVTIAVSSGTSSPEARRGISTRARSSRRPSMRKMSRALLLASSSEHSEKPASLTTSAASS